LVAEGFGSVSQGCEGWLFVGRVVMGTLLEVAIGVGRFTVYGVPKRRLLILRRRGYTQKTIFHYNNAAKAWKLEFMYLGFTLSLIIPLVLHIRLYSRHIRGCMPRKSAGCTTKLNRGLGICLDGPQEATDRINDVFSGIWKIIPHVRSVISQ
jgi:hypothetical protein